MHYTYNNLQRIILLRQEAYVYICIFYFVTWSEEVLSTETAVTTTE